MASLSGKQARFIWGYIKLAGASPPVWLSTAAEPTGKEARKLDPLVLCEIPQRQSFLSGGEMILKEGGIKE
ncbi:MAG: hypothetical protein WCA27_29825 [Candidatus Sulfotelmatobacter sp.]